MGSTPSIAVLGASIAALVAAGAAQIHTPALQAAEIAVSLAFLASGVVAIRFGAVQFRGDTRRAAFLVSAISALVASIAFVLADHMAVLFGSWLLTSLAVDLLLRRNTATGSLHAAADGKFLASRLGDLLLLAGLGMAWSRYDTASIREMAARAASEGGAAPVWIGILIAGAALAKSAQVPFHGWLPRTLEAPTAVSALLHAGIVNAGAVLLLKFAPLLASNLSANVLLVAVGCASLFTGLSASWTRPDTKGQLAWSTVAQMGFVMVEIGLGATSIALVHLLGHGIYKSWAFLSSGGLETTPQTRPSLKPGTVVLRDAVFAGAAMASLAIVAEGVPSAGDLALLCAVAVALGTWNPGVRGGALVVAGFALALEIAHLASHRIAGAPSLRIDPPVWAIAVLALPAATLLLFHWMQARILEAGRLGRILYLPMARGWYLDRPLGRAVRGFASFRHRFNAHQEVL